MSGCEESFLTWNAQYPPLLLREQCIDKERSEDTLPNLLRNVNRSASARVFPRSCYKLSTGWGKAGPALRCNNKCGYGRSSVRNTSCCRDIFTPTTTNLSQHFPHILRQWCFKMHCLTGDRMNEWKFPGMESLSVDIFHIRIIEIIPDQWMSEILKMYTDLMGTAGF